MTWDEMIQMRTLKERDHLNPLLLLERNNTVATDFNGGLSFLEESAINFRFLWELPIGRVADRLGMSWDGADELIDRAVKKLLNQFGSTGASGQTTAHQIATLERGIM